MSGTATPRPWTVNGNTISGKDPIDERGNYNESSICTISHGWRNHETDQANAALIIHAVNTLDEVKAALRWALHEVELCAPPSVLETDQYRQAKATLTRLC